MFRSDDDRRTTINENEQEGAIIPSLQHQQQQSLVKLKKIRGESGCDGDELVIVIFLPQKKNKTREQHTLYDIISSSFSFIKDDEGKRQKYTKIILVIKKKLVQRYLHKIL